MLLVGKKSWFGKLVLAAYMLLVCFGHALHALPGHQHGGAGASCSCSASPQHPLESVCSHTSSAAKVGDCSENGKRLSLDCPFGHKTKNPSAHLCMGGKTTGECCDQIVPQAAWQNVGCDDLCLICDLLAAPQAVSLVLDVDLRAVLIEHVPLSIYVFCGADVLSSFSARGPPSFIA